MVPRRAEREHPVDLVEEQVERPFVRGAAAVLPDDEVADGAELVLAEHGARGVERRVEHEQARSAERGLELVRRGQERAVRAADEGHGLGAGERGVVRVVPGRNGEDDTVAGVDEHVVGGVDAGPDAGGDEHGLGGAVAAEPFAVEDADALAELGNADAGRVIGLALPERGLDAVAQRLGDGEMRGFEVSDGQVANGDAAGGELADLGSDTQDLGAGHASRPCGDPRSRRLVGGGPGARFHLDSPNFHTR